MKLRKLLAMGLAAVMAVSAMSIPALASEDDVVYTLIGEDGNEIVYTQADLDAGHWDKEMLGEVAPIIYEDFPMSIDKFVNDLGEISLDLIYMKNIDDFSNVSMSINNLGEDAVIFSDKIEENSFYSPTLIPDNTYVLTLVETTEEKNVTYKRLVTVNKSDANMPDYVYNGNSENSILVANTNDLEKIINTDENGDMIIDNRNNPYIRFTANEFLNFCSSLSDNNTYKIFTEQNGEQYFGFIDGNNSNNIYNYDIIVSDYEVLTTPSLMSTPSLISLSEVKNRAVQIGFEDYAFRIDDNTSPTKFNSFKIDLTGVPLKNINNYSQYNLRTTVRGDVTFGIYLWLEVDGKSYPVTLTAETSNTVRNFSINLKASKYGITSDSEVEVYGAVYFPKATNGYGMVYSRLVEGYEDDVTGSFYEALNDTSMPGQITDFREYKTTSGIDVDTFCLKSVADCYKLSIRNRSAADQIKLDNGQICNGSGEKILTLYSGRYSINSQATAPTDVLQISEYSTYAIPKNVDMSIYTEGSDHIIKSFAKIRNKSLTSATKGYYQISYVVWGDDSVVED